MKVLVPIEGSEFSQAAIEKCCKMFGESENTEVRLISAAEPAFVPTEPFAVSADYVHELDAAAFKRATDAVAVAENTIRNGFPGLARGLTTIVIKGPPNQAIIQEAENWGADLIVMGSHGYGFWQRALLGSVSDSVVHHAPCSVLVVRTPKEEKDMRG